MVVALIPAGDEVTIPVAATCRNSRVSVNNDVELNVAVTVLSASAVTVQSALLPEHPPPLHMPTVEPEFAVAVNLTLVPVLKDSSQSEPQLMPDGVEATV